MKVVIIGAGPAGLVTCKTLLESSEPDFPFDPVILEQEEDIGGTFRYRTYENATLVSSKQLTAFSDFRVPLADPDYLTAEEYVEYLRRYSKYFDIEKRIQLQCKVIRISRDPKGGHCIAYVRKRADCSEWETTPTTIHAQFVAVCTGLHALPAIPTIPGINNIMGLKSTAKSDLDQRVVFHSASYKRREQLRERRVLILGTGETGMDLAYESVKANAKEVVLCTRSGFISFPKILNNFTLFGFKFASKKPVPVDTLINNLGETAYVHPWVEQSHLRWLLSDFVISCLLWVVSGTKSGWNQWAGEVVKERRGRAYVLFNKSYKVMPYVNRPFRKRSALLDYFSRPFDAAEDSPPNTNFVVDLAPFPTAVLPSGQVVFPKSTRKDALRMARRDVRPDMVIYATGYKEDIRFLDAGYPLPSEADIRNVVKTGGEDFAFIGFLRPGFGAIPPIAEIQAMFWVCLLKGQVRKPLPPSNYHLLVHETARIQYGIDHSLYTSTLAKDIGASPGLWELWKDYGTHVLICYCLGAAFTPFYRLVGPYRASHAATTVKTELWETITRRGLFGNFAIAIIPMFFYSMVNAAAYMAESIWQVFKV